MATHRSDFRNGPWRPPTLATEARFGHDAADMRHILFSLALCSTLSSTGCQSQPDDKPKADVKDAKPKADAKKDVKTDAKADVKTDAKTDTKADVPTDSKAAGGWELDRT